jgi:DNA polymerase-3 subunit gamma/tau
VRFAPARGQFQIDYIDEVHMLSNAAFNALLKTLEEPPAHVIFILATTEMHKIPLTVLSRCQRHEFRRVPSDDILGQLNNIIKSEKIRAEPEALRLIARQSAGGMRDAISLLDQMASTGMEITLGLTQTVLGTATSQTVLDLIGAVLDRKPSTGMDAIHTALDSGTDPRQLGRQVVDYLRALLLIQMENASQVELATETRPQALRHARAFTSADVLRMIRAFNIAASDLRGGWQPSLPLELALSELMELHASSAPTENRDAAEPMKEKKVETLDLLPSKEVEKPINEVKQLTLEQVSKAWKQVRALIKPLNPILEGSLNSCRLLEVKNGVLVLGFESMVVSSKVDSPESLEMTRKAIMKVCAGELSIKCVVTNAKQAVPPSVKTDGMVAAALKAGGEIVDIQE